MRFWYPSHDNAQKPPLKAYTDVSGDTRGINLGLVFRWACSGSSSSRIDV